MNHQMLARVSALSCAAALLLTGCSTPAGPTASGGDTTAQSQEEKTVPQGMKEVELATVSMQVPEGWVETPAEHLDETWKAGMDDAPENQKARLAVAPTYGTSNDPVAEEATLLEVTKEDPRMGKSLKVDQSGKADVAGAQSAATTKFHFKDLKGNEMIGLRWLLQNANGNNVTLVELAGSPDILTDDLIQKMEGSLQLNPEQ